MSIANEISRIQEARDTLRAKAVALGVGLSTDNITQLATKYDGIVDRGTPNAEVKDGESVTLSAGYYHGGSIKGVGGSAPSLQSKSVTYTANGTNTITPDEGYDGLSSVGVTVNVARGGGGGIIDGLKLMYEYFSFKATDVRFNNCVFKDGATVEFWTTSTNVSFTGCGFENSTIKCTQSIRDAIENDSSNFVENVQFEILT